MKGNHYWIPPSDGMTQLHGLRNTVCCTVHKFMLKLTKLKKPTVSVNMTQKQSFFPGSSFQMDWGNIENFPVVQQTKYEIIFRKHRWCVLQTKKGPGTVHLVISTQFNTLKLMLLKYVSHYGIYSLHICTGFRPTWSHPCDIFSGKALHSSTIQHHSASVTTAWLSALHTWSPRLQRSR